MGWDKARLVIDGEMLVERAARRLARVADPVILACGARPLAVPGCASVGDAAPDAGPLGGIVAGLRASPHVLLAVVAVDMPWLDAGLLNGLVQAWEGEDAVVPVGPRGREPLHALYSRAALPLMEAALQAGELRLHDVLRRLRVRQLEFAEDHARFAVNLNCLEDLVSLEGRPGCA